MNGFLSQNVASQYRFFGHFVSSDDGVSSATDLGTISSSDILLYRPGATTPDNPVNNAIHMGDGDYYILFDAADVDENGIIVLTCKVEGALYVRATYWVQPQGLYDAFNGVTANEAYLEAAVKSTNYFNRIF